MFLAEDGIRPSYSLERPEVSFFCFAVPPLFTSRVFLLFQAPKEPVTGRQKKSLYRSTPFGKR
jgi:hypothetical protein